MIRKCFFLIIFIFVIYFCFSEKLRMGVFLLEPFMIEGETEPYGITVQYWKEYLAPKMGYEIEVLGPFPVKRVQKMLENGEVDIVSQLTKIPMREKLFLYPETHLTEIISCILVEKDSKLNVINKPDDLFGMKIGFLATAYIPPFMINPKIKIELVSDEDYRQININKLLAKRIDACLDINYISFLYYIKQRGYENRVKVILLPVEPAKVYSIFRKTKKGEELSKAYDMANREGLRLKIFEKMTKDFLSKPIKTKK